MCGVGSVKAKMMVGVVTIVGKFFGKDNEEKDTKKKKKIS